MVSPDKTFQTSIRLKKPSPNKDTAENGRQINEIGQVPPPPTIEVERRAPRIAILVDTSSDWGRKLVQGVNSYAVKHGPWKLWIGTHGTHQSGGEDLLNLPANWDGDGVIAPIESEETAQKIVAYGCPVVNVSAHHLSSVQIPHVTSNIDTVAKMSVQHFEHRGIKNFGYVGPRQIKCVQQHAAAFQDKVRSAGFRCQLFACEQEASAFERWSECREKLAEWLVSLPKPIGIFTWRTDAAIQILDVCNSYEISVPDDVSVLAGDDDTLLCNTTTPTLSGVVTASEHIGFAAARRLDQMLNGKGTPSLKTCELIDPIMVALRQSTDSLAITDPDLLTAVRFIRTNACRGITVQEVAESVPIGRRSLERKFKDCFGRTPLDEIQRLRLARVRELLVKTDLPIAKISQDAGFGTPEYMTTMFKCRYGLTPLKFRSQSRAR